MNKNKECRLIEDWKNYSEEKQEDLLFMVCPACGIGGCHVGGESKKVKKVDN